jgi:hypothetical protein
MAEHRFSYPTVIELRRVVPQPIPRAVAADPRLRSVATVAVRPGSGVTPQPGLHRAR